MVLKAADLTETDTGSECEGRHGLHQRQTITRRGPQNHLSSIFTFELNADACSLGVSTIEPGVDFRARSQPLCAKSCLLVTLWCPLKTWGHEGGVLCFPGSYFSRVSTCLQFCLGGHLHEHWKGSRTQSSPERAVAIWLRLQVISCLCVDCGTNYEHWQ